jgi:hypothetical protein
MIAARFHQAWITISLTTALTCCKGAGFTEPDLNIRVQRTETGYEFSFESCGGWFKSTFDVSDIVVRKGVGPADASPIQCELTKQSPSVRNLRGHWQYAASAAGYRMTRCDPLKPNEAYQVHVGGATVGWRAFTLKENGDVVLGDGSCH